MGRSPFFAEYVRPIHPKPVLRVLDDVFSYFFNRGDIAFYDESQVATIRGQVYICITESEHNRIPLLERSCSIYRKMEDYFPTGGSIYRVRSAIRYKFRNRHSGNRVFEYNVLELANLDTEYFTTFCIKTDGAILNIESLSLRGYANKVNVSCSIEQLCAGQGCASPLW